MTEQSTQREQQAKDQEVFTLLERKDLLSYHIVLLLNKKFQDYLNQFKGQDALLLFTEESLDDSTPYIYRNYKKSDIRKKHLKGRIDHVDESGVIFDIESAFVTEADGTQTPHSTGTLKYPYSESEFSLNNKLPYHEYIASITVQGQNILDPIYLEFDIKNHFMDLIKRYTEALKTGFVQEAITKREPIGTRFIHNETDSGKYFWLLQEDYLRFLKQYVGQIAEVSVFEMDAGFDDINGDIHRGRGAYTLRSKIQAITEQFIVLSDEFGSQQVPFSEGKRQANWQKSKHISRIIVENKRIL